jgi:hypothetical protein
MNDEGHIIVRDRRQKHQFSIHNRVVDEWLPIIGQTGYALYSLYVRMANRDDERCWPGYTLIKQHLSIGYSSVSDYNKLLEWCGLVHIERGDATHPNEYYILDIPPVTPETLEKLRQAATDELSPKSKFRQTILNRLENWQPIQALWGSVDSSKPIIVHPAQMTLPLEGASEAGQAALDTEQVTPVAEEGTPLAEDPAPGEDSTPPAEGGTPPAEDPTPVAEEGTPPAEGGLRLQESNNPKQQSESTIRKNNPEQQSTTTPETEPKADVGVLVGLLADFGVQEPVRSQITGNGVDLAVTQAWIWYTQAQENLRDRVGFVVSRLQQHVPPPDDLLALARVVAQLDARDLELLCEYANQRRWDGRWWRLFDEEQGDGRLACLFDEDLLETWYTHVYKRQIGR